MKRSLLILFIIALFTNSTFAQSAPIYDTLSVGNIKQVVSYSGNKDLPLILFLHGGPASSRMKQAAVFSSDLQKSFMVVQWDQRDAGRTLALNKSTVPNTLELMESDTYEVITLLLKKFNRKKLYLVGESWGTVLGFKMAEKHPELLNAYIAFSPVVNQTKSELILLDKLKSEAKEKGDLLAQKELNTVKVPFENYEQIYVLRKWMFDYDGHKFSESDLSVLKTFLEDWSKVWLPTWNAAIRQNLFVQLPEIKCPVYFFIGEKDFQTNFNLAKDYFKQLKAPKKDIFLFENAGHSVLTEEAKEVQRIIIEDILKNTDK
ncbi:alpha/beta fold hydrolase [Sphingobacterium sp. MYb382]|uniref:alpha/beta fold hydrolase n=1 Tax=Sphingobacterium sp. MYb382 TaxID=2745278 RepID=UPI0030A891C0